MYNEYSIKKIIKNGIGYLSIVFLIISIILFIITIYFVSNLYLKIQLILTSLIFFIYISISSIIFIKNIVNYFKNSIEANAIVKDNIYIGIGKLGSLFEAYGAELEQGNKFAYRNNYKNNIMRREYKKNGAVYEYYIDGEIYISSSKFIINDVTMSIKEGCKITVLVNRKNKNKSIIKDLYKK